MTCPQCDHLPPNQTQCPNCGESDNSTETDQDGLPVVGVVIDGFQLTSIIGQGGMARVYHAVDSDGGEHAIKFLFPNLLSLSGIQERFKREAAIQYTLRHPHIISASNVLYHPPLFGIVMKFTKGRSLEEILIEQGPLSIATALRILLQCLQGLSCAHNRQVVHRDIKPSNILIETNPDNTFHCFLMDFGIAKAVEDKLQLTATNSRFGTYDYMAPEQYRSTKHVDGRADLYSLGVTLFIMLTGHLPFERKSEVELMKAHMLDPIPALSHYSPSFPEELDQLIQWAMAKEPQDRFQTAEDFSHTITQILNQANPDWEIQPDINTYIQGPSMTTDAEALQYLSKTQISPTVTEPVIVPSTPKSTQTIFPLRYIIPTAILFLVCIYLLIIIILQ